MKTKAYVPSGEKNLLLDPVGQKIWTRNAIATKLANVEIAEN